MDPRRCSCSWKRDVKGRIQLGSLIQFSLAFVTCCEGLYVLQYILLRHFGVSIFEIFECTTDGSKASGELLIRTYRVTPFPSTVKRSFVSVSCLKDGKATTTSSPVIPMEKRVRGLYLCERDDGQTPAEIMLLQGGT